ncbi:MAG: tetratricopeptide repeat protein [Candidatus Eremiobacteraeota bacterium]|nr:tetratricopeptide repeat protein [Candidatus Eremiobacteraeota bacterium]
MRKSSPEELRRLRVRSKEEERRKEEGTEKRISINESPKQRKMKIIVVWIIAGAFIIMSVGALLGFGIGAINRDDEEESKQQKPISQAEKMKKEMERNIKFYKEQIKEKPEEINNYKSLAAIYAQTSNYDEAFKTYQEALKIDPKDTFVMRGISEVYIGQKKYPEARKQVMEIIKIEEKVNHPPLYLMLSVIDYEEKNTDGAIVNINKAIEIDPGNIRFYIVLSQFYLKKGDKKSAKSTLDKGIEVAKAMNDGRNEMMLNIMKQRIDAPKKVPGKGGSLTDPKFKVVPIQGGKQKGGAASLPSVDRKIPDVPKTGPDAGKQPVKPGDEKQPTEPDSKESSGEVKTPESNVPKAVDPAVKQPSETKGEAVTEQPGSEKKDEPEVK